MVCFPQKGILDWKDKFNPFYPAYDQGRSYPFYPDYYLGSNFTGHGVLLGIPHHESEAGASF